MNSLPLQLQPCPRCGVAPDATDPEYLRIFVFCGNLRCPDRERMRIATWRGPRAAERLWNQLR